MVLFRSFVVSFVYFHKRYLGTYSVEAQWWKLEMQSDCGWKLPTGHSEPELLANNIIV